MATQSITLFVNGVRYQVEVAPRSTLLSVLREQLHLTGTKNGCSTGHCGACTVIVEGKAERACIYLARRADGKAVQTIEGLAPAAGGLHPLQQAFVTHGAVQCGYCTPGLIMAAKALLDRNSQPTRQEIIAALEPNLCRCTGYSSIVVAIQEASRFQVPRSKFQGNVEHETWNVEHGTIGRSLPRPDAVAKVTGAAKYAGDLEFPSMLYAAVLRSRYPHARLLRVDTAQAKALPGVVAVLTAADVPGAKNHGISRPDWPVLAYDKVRYLGDAVAIVAAETAEIARQALGLIEVAYEPLPGVFTAQEALAPDAPAIHSDGNLLKHIPVRKGDVAAGFAQADVIVENEYHTPAVDHVFLEPEAGVATVDGDGKITVYVGSQIPFADRKQVAAALALPLEKVRIVHTPVGGAFGGKEDISVQIHVALLAQATQRPVKLVYSREESIVAHPKRHATTIRLKTGATRDGRLTAVQATIWGDTGAYASLGEHVMTRSATHAAGPYEVPNVWVDCYAAYTNNTPAGAMRGFGVPQVCFAMETQMDILAERLGLDPLELRRRNALRLGSTTATGQVLRESVGLLETIDRVAAALQEADVRSNDFSRLGTQPCPQPATEVVTTSTWRRGIGIACCYKNVGLGEGVADSAGADVELLDDGSAIVRAGAAEVGQGVIGVAAQIVAEELGVPYGRIRVILGDTAETLDGGATTASRQTFITGNAVRLAACQVREALAQAVAEELDVPPDSLVFQEGRIVAVPAGRSVDLRRAIALAREEGRQLRAAHVYTAPRTAPLGQPGDAHFAFGYGTQAAEVEVDTTTGQVRVLRVIAAHDVGRAINPLALRGQLEGGVMMGLGYALLEQVESEEGRIKNATLARYKVPRISQTPEVVPILVEDRAAEGPYGAKGVGEITSIPTAPAILNAIHDAVGVRLCDLPATPDRIKQALAEKE